jgi:hypothetical protein
LFFRLPEFSISVMDADTWIHIRTNVLFEAPNQDVNASLRKANIHSIADLLLLDDDQLDHLDYANQSNGNKIELLRVGQQRRLLRAFQAFYYYTTLYTNNACDTDLLSLTLADLDLFVVSAYDPNLPVPCPPRCSTGNDTKS